MAAQNFEYEVVSEADNVENSILDDDNGNQDSSRKRRHTPNQIQIMEAFFKDCPNPNEKERQSLGQALGLEPLQVKFWFQNKRTQQKTLQKRSENSILKSQNEKLRAENKNLKDAASKIPCLRCGQANVLQGISSPPLEQLKHENARLKKELESLQSMAKSYMDKTMWNDPQFSTPLVTPRYLDLGSSSYGIGGQQIKEEAFFGGNRQFNNNNNVAHSLSPFDEQMVIQQRVEGTFWTTPAYIDEYNKTKKTRHF